MRKADLNNLCAGSKVISKKDSTILEVVAMDKEQGKAIMNNGKVYSFSTIYRWFDLAPVEEVEQPVEEKTVEEKVVEDKPVQPIKPTNTSEKVVAKENHEDHTETSDSTVLAGENTIDEVFSQFNKALDDHNAYFKPYKQYIGVLTPRKKGTLLQLRKNREGSINIDIKKCIWEKLKAAYKIELQRKYNACIYDKTRGYIRLNNMEDVSTFTVLLLVALS